MDTVPAAADAYRTPDAPVEDSADEFAHKVARDGLDFGFGLGDHVPKDGVHVGDGVICRVGTTAERHVGSGDHHDTSGPWRGGRRSVENRARLVAKAESRARLLFVGQHTRDGNFAVALAPHPKRAEIAAPILPRGDERACFIDARGMDGGEEGGALIFSSPHCVDDRANGRSDRHRAQASLAAPPRVDDRAKMDAPTDIAQLA